MNDNVKKLLEPIKESPDLPIVPIVDIKIAADDSFNNQLGHAEFMKLLAANGWGLKMLTLKI